ncbi:MAG: helix-turn-helix domain-containing protein [Actinomycetota bacterium]
MVSGHDSRVRLLDAADRLMYERGYEAVGVAELCRVAEVKKGSFYFLAFVINLNIDGFTIQIISGHT